MKNMHDLKYGLAWDDSFSLGNEPVDKQHQKLFETVNDLIGACEEGRDVEKLKETLDFLVNYTVRHFADEEDLQLAYNYPGYNAHKRIHENFKATVGDLVQRFAESGSSSELSRDVNKIVARWLVEHITQEDKKISEHIRRVKGRITNNG